MARNLGPEQPVSSTPLSLSVFVAERGWRWTQLRGLPAPLWRPWRPVPLPRSAVPNSFDAPKASVLDLRIETPARTFSDPCTEFSPCISLPRWSDNCQQEKKRKFAPKRNAKRHIDGSLAPHVLTTSHTSRSSFKRAYRAWRKYLRPPNQYYIEWCLLCTLGQHRTWRIRN